MPLTPAPRAVALVLGAALLLTACSGGTEVTTSGPGPSGSGSTGTASPPTAVPTEAVVPPDVVEALPDGTLTERGRIEVTDARGLDAAGALEDGGFTNGGFVWTDDAVVMVTELGQAIAIDRVTGQQRWSVRLPAVKSDPFVCLTPTPPPGATAVVVIVGLSCDQHVALDLATGAELSTRTLPSRSPEGTVQIGDWSYFSHVDGALFRLEPDGSASSLGPAELPDGQIAEILTAEDDVLVVKTTPAEAYDPGAGIGRFVGYRISADDEASAASRLWDVSVRERIGRAPFLFVDEGWRGAGAVIVNELPRGAVPAFQISRLDPDTGDLAGRARVAVDDPEGFPEWADPLNGVRSTLVDGADVYSAGRNDAEVRSIVRYDLEGGESVWRWVPKRSRGLPQEVNPVALTDDGTRLYVGVGSGFDKLALVELDATTGTQLRSWRVPAAVADEMYFGTFSIDDGQVVALDSLYPLAAAAQPEKRRRLVLSLLDLE